VPFIGDVCLLPPLRCAGDLYHPRHTHVTRPSRIWEFPPKSKNSLLGSPPCMRSSTRWQTRRSDDPWGSSCQCTSQGVLRSRLHDHRWAAPAARGGGGGPRSVALTRGVQLRMGGPTTFLSAVAIHDAHLHSAQNRCRPGCPTDGQRQASAGTPPFPLTLHLFH
jgi:hypothetical protein